MHGQKNKKILGQIWIESNFSGNIWFPGPVFQVEFGFFFGCSYIRIFLEGRINIQICYRYGSLIFMGVGSWSGSKSFSLCFSKVGSGSGEYEPGSAGLGITECEAPA